MRARYIKELYLGPTIEFTPSGHVDMDVFDESDNREKEVLADFYDEEIEKLCKPIIESHISKLQKDDDTVNELLIEKTDYKKIGIGFFWKEIVHHESGFYTDDIGWDEETTDIFNKKYDWENDGFLKQIPKKKDFQKAFSIFGHINDVVKKSTSMLLNPENASNDTMNRKIKQYMIRA